MTQSVREREEELAKRLFWNGHSIMFDHEKCWQEYNNQKLYREQASLAIEFISPDLSKAVEALEWYAAGCGTASSIKAAARGDIDLGDATEAFAEDCGDRAREALKALKG